VKRRGFSLIELLVVVVIVGILASLLLPALARSKETARRINCASNLRQMIIAAQFYANESDSFFPISYYNETRDGASYAVCWDLTTRLGNPASVEPGLLWQGGNAKEIQQCPAFRGKANWLEDPYTGYNYYTSYIGHGQQESVAAPAKVFEARNPGGTVIFGDGQYKGGANKFMRAPWPNPGDEGFKGRWAGTQGFRHGGQSNAGFCDGHVESLKRRFVENRDGAGQVGAGTGFLSESNELYDLE
jgi:prepilin-type N-terminal cleavage/methylation domain-containing protein/prepilin-type processing-associated H-X9-DG protein